MEPDILLKMAGIGLLIAVICQLLTKAGREDVATLVTIAGMVVVLFWVLDMVTELMEKMRHVFLLS
ncbi:MAG: stage III sporulation protein AC [Clostridia bacterium]|nr:stage III sporulation protein AC [Clostridia bacterium]MBR6809097.1 stage III sporulation protein AC [Clostridia bacterium]